jgi:hypothetical protein
MAKELKYTKTTVTKLQAIGELNIEDMTIEVEGEVKKLPELLKDFNTTTVNLTVQVKEEEEI